MCAVENVASVYWATLYNRVHVGLGTSWQGAR